VYSYVYQGYWEDIGTIRAFFEANLELTAELPRFTSSTCARRSSPGRVSCPGSKINGAEIDHGVISDGCIINRGKITQSIVGCAHAHRRRHATAPDRVHGLRLLRIRGESITEFEAARAAAHWDRKNCRIENAIIDKNARIGDNVVISPAGKPDSVDHSAYFIRTVS